MKEFKSFCFEKFSFDKNSFKASFFYTFKWLNDEIVEFEEIIDFNSSNFNFRKDLDLDIINNLLFHLHIAFWISYYKLYPTSELIIKSGYLDDFQIKFWKKFYLNWLWEFLYKNNIKYEWLFNFVNTITNSPCSFFASPSIDGDRGGALVSDWGGILVPVWWWKDSIVSIELLKEAWIDFDLFVFWKIDDLKQYCVDISWKKILLINRKLSENLFKLNKEWYYNGHVPITWIIAFVMQVVAYIYDYKYLILSNEKSANFWNVKWEWIEINHQYSKSLDFEIDFNNYVKKYISGEIKYFSLLRWLYELKIAEIFAQKWKKYFEVFSSCNKNFKINKITLNPLLLKLEKKWCNTCPKCVFVFSILYPYLEKEEILKIFWHDLYTDKKLEKTFSELLWINWIKPFECVWTNEEIILAMKKSINKFWNKELPYILALFKKEIINKLKEKDFIKIENKLLKIYDEDIIPLYIKNKLLIPFNEQK